MHGSAPSGNATRSGAGLSRKQLGDFTTDRRVLALIAMAFVVGTGGAFAALFLMKLIAFVANLVWFGRISTAVVAMGDVPRTPWMVVAPVLGGLTVGLMARFGSEKIRGHGIPEAIEAILIGGSRMSPKVAILKPLSSAISIGTGGPFGAEGPIIMTGGRDRLPFRPVFSSERRRAQDASRRRRCGGHDGDLRNAHRRRAAGGRTAALRMEAP